MNESIAPWHWKNGPEAGSDFWKSGVGILVDADGKKILASVGEGKEEVVVVDVGCDAPLIEAAPDLRDALASLLRAVAGGDRDAISSASRGAEQVIKKARPRDTRTNAAPSN